MLEIFSKFKPAEKDCYIAIETNGSLVQKRWHYIQHLEKYHLSLCVTPNSFVRSTYDELAGNLHSYESTMSSLRFLRDLRSAERIKEYIVTIVVQDKNYKELPDFIDKCLSEFNPDLIVTRVIKPWFNLSIEISIKNILSPEHPDHDDFLKVLNHPSCKHPKVFHWNEIDNLTTNEQARAFLLSTM